MNSSSETIMTEPSITIDDAWEGLFKKFDILNKIDRDGIFFISADKIRASKKEPRLMAKFDNEESLPIIFKANQLAILPITRGSYAIGRFKAWHKFKRSCSPDPSIFPLPDYIKSLRTDPVRSEAHAINYAYASGIIQDFMGEKLVIPTVAGRMGSGDFDFKIYNQNPALDSQIKVCRAQIEIDGAYEGEESLIVIEAKNNINIDNFIIRQIYYPYRLWESKIQKPVRPVFMTYSNGIFTFREYKFRDKLHYNSLVLERHAVYSTEPTGIQAEEILSIVKKTAILKKPRATFPQADRFERVINLCELLHQQEMDREGIAHNYDFVLRQANYYTDAAIYLGLIEKDDRQQTVCYRLTREGKRILGLNHKQRQLAYCKCILSNPVFNVLMQRWLENPHKPPTNEEIVTVMRSSNIPAIRAASTYGRRATTVKCWLDWMMNLIDS